MQHDKHTSADSAGKKALWFVALWLLGIAGTALLVLPFHLLIHDAMRH